MFTLNEKSSMGPKSTYQEYAATRPAGRCAYSLVLMPSNVAGQSVPTKVMAAIATIATNAAVNPYSKTVGPAVSNSRNSKALRPDRKNFICHSGVDAHRVDYCL